MTDTKIISFIRFSEKAYCKMKALTLGIDDEVMGFIIGSGLEIEDIIVMEQEVSSGSVDIDAETIGKYLTKLIEDGKADLIPKIKGTFHSHNTMGLFWSITDDEQVNRLLTDMPYAISIVTSKGDGIVGFRCRLDFSFEGNKITIDDIPFVINISKEDKWNKWAEKELDKKVKRKVYNNSYSYNCPNRVEYILYKGKEISVDTIVKEMFDEKTCKWVKIPPKLWKKFQRIIKNNKYET